MTILWSKQTKITRVTQRPLPVGGIARVNGDLVVRVDSGRIGRLPQHQQSCFVPEPHNKPSRGVGFGGKIRGDVFGALFPVNRGELDFVRGSRSQISKRQSREHKFSIHAFRSLPLLLDEAVYKIYTLVRMARRFC